MTKCKYGCGKEIFWNEDGPPWIPHEDEALTKIHDCPKNPNKQQPKEPPKTPVAPKPPEKIEKPPIPIRSVLHNVPPLSDDELNFYHKLFHLFKEPVK